MSHIKIEARVRMNSSWLMVTIEVSTRSEREMGRRMMETVIEFERQARRSLELWRSDWTAPRPNAALSWGSLNGDGFEVMLECERLRATRAT